MTLPQINTQRGVPCEPGAAVKARQLDAERARLKAQRFLGETAPQLSPKKREAIMRDQIEAAWRERARDRRRS